MNQPLRMLMIFVRKTFADIVELIEGEQYEAAKQLAEQTIKRIDEGMKEL